MFGAIRRARPSAGTIAVALLAGFAVLVFLFPASGIQPQPPECYSFIGYVVPCEGWVAPLLAAVTALGVGLALWWWIDRRGPDGG